MVVLIAILALFIGAGINHLADRLPARRRVDTAPVCDHCLTPRPRIGWISVLAYMTGRFRCPSCSAPIPIRHPIVELATVLSLVSLYQARGLTPYFLLGAAYICIFILILVTDLEHRLILNVVIFPAIVIALLGSLLPQNPSPQSAVIGGAVGFLFFWLVALVGRGAMGAGDVKLAAFIGIAVGFPNIITALILGIFAGGIAALILVITRIKTVKSYIPYGPFLVFWRSRRHLLRPSHQAIVHGFVARNSLQR